MTSAFRLVTLAAIVTLAPIAIVADEDEGFAHPGFYLGVGGSYVTDTFENSVQDALADAGIGVSIDVDESWGANAVVGYRLLPFLAIEAEYEWIDEFDIRGNGTTVASLEAQSVTGNLKWIVPTWRIQPYLLTGLGATRWELEDDLGLGLSDTRWDLAGRLGLGLDLYLTHHLLLTAGANAVLTDTSVDLLGHEIRPFFYVGGQAGLQYRF